MSLSLRVIEGLAPDQGSLSAAGKLRKPTLWLRLAHEADTSTIWGECQGSGANPYRVIADIDNHGYKCTCPSRKFPCKHSLALMWLFVESAERFVADSSPDWVQEWQGRRRRGATSESPKDGAVKPQRDITSAQAAAVIPEAEPSAIDIAKRAEATIKRRQRTEEEVRDGLDELDQWIGDQLRNGIASFVEDLVARCRRIASRLVDAKAATLASRMDELPSRLLALPRAARPQAALFELGQIALLSRHWRSAPDDADARAAIIQGETREAVLANTNTLRVHAEWEVVGNRVETRRDGLVSQSTWLLDRCSARSRFALLLDFFSASAGRRSAAFIPGQRLTACLAFHASRQPLRAVLDTTAETVAHFDVVRPIAPIDPLIAWRQHLARVPWASETPILLPVGRFVKDSQNRLWWRSESDQHALPLAPISDDALWCGVAVISAVILWNGAQGHVLRIETPIGSAWPEP